jgi:hypothetical protein
VDKQYIQSQQDLVSVQAKDFPVSLQPTAWLSGHFQRTRIPMPWPPWPLPPNIRALYHCVDTVSEVIIPVANGGEIELVGGKEP